MAQQDAHLGATASAKPDHSPLTTAASDDMETSSEPSGAPTLVGASVTTMETHPESPAAPTTNTTANQMEYDPLSGRTIPPANPWIEAIYARRKKQLDSAQGKPQAADTTPAAVRTIPPPRFPPSHYITVIRPHDGLRISEWQTHELARSIAAASHIPEQQFRTLITIQAQPTTNLIVAGTPDLHVADRLSQLTSLTLRNSTYHITAYMKPPPGTSRGVIHGIPDNITQAQLLELTATNRPYLIHARIMGKTRSALLTFGGTRVPYYIKFDCEMLRCRPYRRTLQTCKCCGDVGHRQDVCPQPDKPRCPNCGFSNPTQDHDCVPHCQLCNGPHPTANRDCPKRFRPTPTPYETRPNNQTNNHGKLQVPAEDYPPLSPPTTVISKETPKATPTKVSWSAKLTNAPTAQIPLSPTHPLPPQHNYTFTVMLEEFRQQQQRFQKQLDDLTNKIEKLVQTPLPSTLSQPTTPPEQISALIETTFTQIIETKLAQALKQLIDTQAENLNTLCRNLQTLTDRQNKIELAMQGIKETLSNAHPPKKTKHHPYYD